MKLCVLIVNYNTETLLKDCLQSLFQHRTSVPFEVIVVDNASTDGSVRMLEAFPQVRLIRSEENLGFAGGNNLGLRESTADYTLLLNSDTLVLDGALDALVNAMEQDPRIGILGGKLLNPDRSPQPSCVPMRFPLPYSSPERDCEALWVSGACLLIRRETLAEIGFLDEAFFYTGEDFDWGLRARKAGWKVRFCATAPVVHLGAKTGSQLRDRTLEARHLGRQHFYQKHYGGLGRFYARAQSWVELTAMLRRCPEKREFLRDLRRRCLAFQYHA